MGNILVRNLHGKSRAKVTAVCYLASHGLEDWERSIKGGLGSADHDCQSALLCTHDTCAPVSLLS